MGAYKGYLIKVGDYVIPSKYIRAETYKVTKYGQDLDSYTDADGILHRNPLVHWVPKVEFETTPLHSERELDDLLGNIQRNYLDQIAKDCNCEIYVPEIRNYVTRHCYMPDIEMTFYGNYNNEIQMEQYRLAFIGY